MLKKTPIVLTLIAVNVLLFAAGEISPQLDLRRFLALHFWQHQNHAIWQYISHMFMHADTGHLLFNMFGLFMFGTALERLLGAKKFLLLYFAAGIGAGLIQNFVNWYQFADIQGQLISAGAPQATLDTIKASPFCNFQYELAMKFCALFNTPMVGASGALYGILVAYALIYPNNKLALLFFPFPIAAKYFIPAVLLLDLFSGVTGFSLFGRNIAHFAHLGGALIGFLLMMIWRQIAVNRRPKIG